MSGQPGPAVPDPPPTVDHPVIAEALQQVADLEDRPLAEHHARLSRVHDVLHEVLHSERGPR